MQQGCRMLGNGAAGLVRGLRALPRACCPRLLPALAALVCCWQLLPGRSLSSPWLTDGGTKAESAKQPKAQSSKAAQGQ